MLILLFFVVFFVFFFKAYSLILCLILLEVLSFIILLSFSLFSTFSGPFIYLVLFSLFVLLAVSGVLVYFSYSRLYGRDYLAITSVF